MEERASMCRICTAQCGTVVRLENGRVTLVRADRDHPVGRGFACIKGLQAPEAMYQADRILRPLKKTTAGFVEVGLEQALDEIAVAVARIVETSGADAIAAFKGTQTYQNATASEILPAWIAALGSRSYYTTNTIDQSSHIVTMSRMGMWDAGKPGLEQCDVVLLVGTNPLVSVAGYGLLDYDPVKRLKAERKRGLKLILIDPRRTETAANADHHLQPFPGNDAAIMASILHVVLREGWEDRAFCERFTNGVAAIKAAVERFSPSFTGQVAGLDPAAIETAAAMFARDAKRGIAIIGTGGTMAPRSNLSDHLVETLNVICGRVRRAGDLIPNPGVVRPPRTYREAVLTPGRGWESGPKTSTGHGAIFGERMSGILADEMLATDAHRIRALFVQGANPAVALPNQAKAVAGLSALDLLVAVEPFMTATAQLSHYIIPPKMLYERTDIAKPPDLEGFLSGPNFNQYLPALVDPPAGSQVIDDWYLYWSLAKRLGLTLNFGGTTLDFDAPPPTTDDLLDVLLKDARIPLDELRTYPRGHIFDAEDVFVEEAPDDGARFELAPDDVIADLDELHRSIAVTRSRDDAEYPFRLIVRRIRSSQNSFGRTLSDARNRGHSNPLFVHPADLAKLDLVQGDRVKIAAKAAELIVTVSADDSMRCGVVSMTHCWGVLPGGDYDAVGVSTSRLVDTEAGVEPINAMPTMSAIPVRLEAVEVLPGATRAVRGDPIFPIALS